MQIARLFFNTSQSKIMGNIIVRHADLSKMSDKILRLEAQQLFDNIQALHKKLGISLIDRMNRQHCAVPSWKYMQDMQITVDRLEAVLDELNYRSIP
jgi:alanine-alpha-ketoisovalerate/valine-pyruvate aminotransferase